MKKLLSSMLVVVLVACGGNEATVGLDPVTGEGVQEAAQNLIADDLYRKLREAENLMPMPAPSQEVVMGTLDAASGSFTGLTPTWQIDPRTHKPYQVNPVTSISAVDAVLVFNVINATSLTATANGQTVSAAGNQVRVNVRTAASINWSMTAGGSSASGSLYISRAGVNGLGAFTVAALPISIVYEPPMNQARTNSATVGFRSEMTTITTLSNSQGSTSKWTGPGVFQDIMTHVGSAIGVTPYVRGVISAGRTLFGSVESQATSGTTVNTDSTLGLTQVNASSITTNARLGAGRGDLIVFYKDARVAWAMEAGQVVLTLIDHGPLVIATVDTLRNDLAAVRAGLAAPVTGLDAPTLEALISLDPLAGTSSRLGAVLGGGVALSTSRFKKETTLLLNGTTYNNSVSHTVTQSEKTSVLNTTTTVRECHAGWLSLVGIGVSRTGTFSTTVSLGTSRTDLVSNTVSASFNLSAAATESYQVEVHYDDIFGSFLTRAPPAPIIVLAPLSL